MYNLSDYWLLRIECKLLWMEISERKNCLYLAAVVSLRCSARDLDITESYHSIWLRNEICMLYVSHIQDIQFTIIKKWEREIHLLLDRIDCSLNYKHSGYQRCAILANLWAILSQFLPIFTIFTILQPGDCFLSCAILLYTFHVLDVLKLVFLEAATSAVEQDANLVQVQVYPKVEPAWIVFALESSVSLQSSLLQESFHAYQKPLT
jgi:hypothetical protein